MKIGVIGAGAISEIYLQNMIHRFPDMEVTAISSAHMISAERKEMAHHVLEKLSAILDSGWLFWRSLPWRLYCLLLPG